MSTVPLRQPQFIQLDRTGSADDGTDLANGLLAPAATVSPKYFYDSLGSRLFDAITELPEYYPTRTEALLLQLHAGAMAAALPRNATLVDLGAGNCKKAAGLFNWLDPMRYVAVDISADYLQHSLRQLQQQFPALDMLGVGLDFSAGLTLPPQAGAGPRVLFFPGSSIGNFPPAEALRFLRDAHDASLGGGLLIGVDLVKSLAILEPAYDDPLGVTAAFNRNLLLHVNQRIASNFNVADWSHRAFFNATASRIEMHLQALHDVRVQWPGAQRDFKAGERIHTENSYKYTVPDFEKLLQAAGFSKVQVWLDPKAWFAMFWASD